MMQFQEERLGAVALSLNAMDDGIDATIEYARLD